MRKFMKKKRVDYDLTLQDLANRLEVAVSTISGIELGRRGPSGRLAYKLEKELNVDMRRFFLTEEEFEELKNRDKELIK